jgi:hypothetical protein
MASTGIDREIDELYQLPLDEFTAARNALAKRAGGAGGAGIKALQKPPIAAWAVNQLYWHKRDVYDKLIETAETMRAAHANVLSGKRADLRSAGKEHEDALEDAIRQTVKLMQDGGHPMTDATRQAVATTLRGLPADTPGRLSRVLQPGGFEMLAGIPVKAGAKAAPKAAAPAPAPSARKADEKVAAPDPKALARAREAVDATSRALKIAEQAARREEFEAARAAREAEKSARAVTSAEEELEAAKQALDEARKEAAAAEKRRETAARRAAAAEEATETARTRMKEADRELQALAKRK